MDGERKAARQSRALSEAEVLEHGWRYFALHAAQRLTLFNYFIALSGISIAAIAATLQGTPRFSLLGVALGLLLSLLALIFYKLDQRTATLIKSAEIAIAEAERGSVPVSSQVFVRESGGLDAGDPRTLKPHWTYGRSLRVSFATVAAIGLALAMLSGLRAADIVRWDIENPEPKRSNGVSNGGSQPPSRHGIVHETKSA